jgi:DHA1 family multidrug resistance protein-like MFS transporter
VVGGAFSDLFGNETRGIAIAGFSALVFIGPFISPIVGAFITQISWVEMDGVYHWYNGCARTHFGSTAVGGNVRENHIAEEAANIRKETGNFAIHHVSEEEVITFKDLVEKHLLLPLKLLFLEPIVLLITIYTPFIYGILYLFLEAYPIVFAQYRGINMAVATLPYIGLIIGVLIGCGIVIFFEPRYNRKLKENNNIPVPEQRLLPMMVGAVIFPVGLFWFAWTGNYPSIHCKSPILYISQR